MSILKALWINNGQLPLNDKIGEKVCLALGTTDMSITECQLDGARKHIDDGYSYFIATVNREDLLQDMYDMLNGRGQMLVISTVKVQTEEYDWKVSSPCGTVRLNFNRLLTPIVQEGNIIDLK